jgi:hypothetical protein
VAHPGTPSHVDISTGRLHHRDAGVRARRFGQR